MAKSKLFGKDVITTQELSVGEIEGILKLAGEMKSDRYGDKYNKLLKNRTFIMFFYNPSLRTRQSFEAAATELGGHAHGVEVAGETIHDAAKVMARFAVGVGIRILETSVDNYGDGDKLLREYAKYADVPIINMADDIYHPCQGLADVMGMCEHNGNQPTKGKTLLQTWSKGALARSYCSVHESLLLTKAGYEGTDYVYSRNWFGRDYYSIGKEAEIKRASDEKYKDWICDEEKMKLANPGAKFVHPMPVDEGAEVTREVNQGPRSIVVDIAENRLHVQKAIMALTMSEEM